jgi:hypothetical protein
MSKPKSSSGCRSISGSGGRRWAWKPKSGNWSGKGSLLSYEKSGSDRSDVYASKDEGGKLTGGGSTGGSSGEGN